jgi:hypothetical protein
MGLHPGIALSHLLITGTAHAKGRIMARTARKTVRLGLEHLENRLQPSVSTCTLTNGILNINSDNTDTSVQITSSNGTDVGPIVSVKDLGNSNTWNFLGTAVSSVKYAGGTAKNAFYNYVSSLPCTVDGSNGGNDYFVSYSQGNTFSGGPGTNTMIEYGGNSTFYGGKGTNTMEGFGNKDRFFGRGISDMVAWGKHEALYAGPGLSTMLAINGQGSNVLVGGTGHSIAWTGAHDFVSGVTRLERVNGFCHGASTAPGSAGCNPANGTNYTYWGNNPLFGPGGPSKEDIHQGKLGDCWLLSSVGAIAQSRVFDIRSIVVDFHDGTYGAAIGGKFYRVDGRFPTTNGQLTGAHLGQGNSLWVPVLEKAFAVYNDNDWEDLNGSTIGQTPATAMEALGCKKVGSWGTWEFWHTGSGAFDKIRSEFYGGYSCILAVAKPSSEGYHNLVAEHVYTVSGFKTIHGVDYVQLRNPWGHNNNPALTGIANPSSPYVWVSRHEIIEVWRYIAWGLAA